jgi:hypothetical protein
MLLQLVIMIFSLVRVQFRVQLVRAHVVHTSIVGVVALVANILTMPEVSH